jgi:hypothetical protein
MLLVVLVLAAAAALARAATPHILFIVVDDLGWNGLKP